MILLLDISNKHQYPALMQSMFRLRKRIFVDKLKWDLPCQGDQEIDQFDDDHSLYFILTPDGKTCHGAWRAYPTTKPYMLETIFPKFFDDKAIIKSPNAYEFSRSVVDWDAFNMEQAVAKRAHIQLFCASIEWALMHQVFEIIAFTDPRITRKTSYLYGTPIWKGPIMDCGAGKAQCVVYRPNIERLQNFRAEMDIEAPILSHFQHKQGKLSHAG